MRQRLRFGIRLDGTQGWGGIVRLLAVAACLSYLLVSCGGKADAPKGAKAAASPTAVPGNHAPVVSSIDVSFLLPVSTYTATATDADGDALSYTWEMVGEPCGRPSVPWTQAGATVRWDHGNCYHYSVSLTPTPAHPEIGSHPEVITLTVSDNRGGTVRCIFTDQFVDQDVSASYNSGRHSFPTEVCHVR